MLTYKKKSDFYVDSSDVVQNLHNGNVSVNIFVICLENVRLYFKYMSVNNKKCPLDRSPQ